MKNEVVKTDITVIGGGLAGVCAAISAARLGQTVSLVQNRPVLGGNSSSEVRVWVVGATGHGTNRYARETGIMGELFVENQYRNPDGNPYFWDVVVLEKVLAEPNIQLFLNTDVHELEMSPVSGGKTIQSVTGWMMGSERKITFESTMFLDCTGDGLIGFMAGATYRLGREARAEFNEDWAPEVADDITLGSTMLFYTKDAGRPVKYIPPSFAKDITQTTIPERRIIRSGDNGCHYWWIEWGGELDTVHDNERIRDELWSVIYGIWDYIKNSGKFDAENMTLEWVGSVPGKREYRRFVGDYMLNQNDIVQQVPFDDRIAFGGWSIDLHPPQGMYSTEHGSKHFHADGIYHIPFRTLYSENISNLMFAGRNISASHVAFGTTRVMATCAVVGEAAGTGAALSVQKGISPRELYATDMAALQQVLLRQDASIIGLRNEDQLDIARQATVTASSSLSSIEIVGGNGNGSGNGNSNEKHLLEHAVAQLFPIDQKLDTVAWLIDASEATTLTFELYRTGLAQNYVPHERVQTKTVSVAAGTKQWIDVDFGYESAGEEDVFVVIYPNEHVHLYLSDEPLFGVLNFQNNRLTAENNDILAQEQKVSQWSMRGLVRTPFCMKVSPATTVYAAERIIDGYNRPYGGPHLWMSEALSDAANNGEEWIQLAWNQLQSIKRVEITFNDDVNEDLINLHHHRTPFEAVPEVVKNYRVEAYVDGRWTILERVENNYVRKRVHLLDQLITSDQLRIVVESTNGSAYAQIVEVRVYE